MLVKSPNGLSVYDGCSAHGSAAHFWCRRHTTPTTTRNSSSSSSAAAHSAQPAHRRIPTPAQRPGGIALNDIPKRLNHPGALTLGPSRRALKQRRSPP